MRKIVFIFVLFVASTLLFGGDKFFISAGTAATFPADERFRELYDSVQFGPVLKAGYNFFENLYLWLGYSSFSASYTYPLLLEEANINQHFLALGAGWETSRGRRLQSDFFAALVLAGFNEQFMGAKAKDTALGFELGTGLRYFIKNKVFVGAALSYSEARISLVESEIISAGRRLLGGLRLIANLGIRL